MSRTRQTLGEGWTVWRHGMVRGAGFPFALLDEVFRSSDEAAALLEVAREPRFREAVIWQNRKAVTNGLDRLLQAGPDAAGARNRKRQLLVARYLQRYCAKNDTIGFFGPVGWTGVGGEPCFAAGSELIEARSTHFEPWALMALARSDTEEDARLAAPVRLPGHLRLDGRELRGPTGTVELTFDEASWVRCADGSSAAQILQRFAPHPTSRRRWLELLRRMVAKGYLRWELPITVSLRPEESWRRWADSPNLESICDLKDRVGRAAGNAADLEPALRSLEETFEARTGTAAWRNPGQNYAGRGLLYEECRRAISMDLGRAPLERVAPALQLLLCAARWFTFEISVRLARELRSELQRLGGKSSLPEFWEHTSALYDVWVPPVVEVVANELRSRLNAIWEHAESRADGLHLDLSIARRLVGREFAAPGPGWPGARHHAPDLMWDASTPEALLAGQGTPVLSELHPGVTPFTTLSALSLCPRVEEMREEWAMDFPSSLVSPIPWEDFARSTQDARLAEQHWHLDLGRPYASELSADRVLRSADYEVVENEGRLRAVPRGDGPEFDLLEVFERRIKLRAATGFSLSDGAEAGPRRYLGPLVVQRAHRRFDDLPFAKGRHRAHERIHDWRAAHDLPERVFVRSPSEVKPIYVDFRSTISVEMFLRLARGSDWLSLTEMYPGPEGLWLRDGRGRSYTSEVRVIAVDPQPFDPAPIWKAVGDRSRRPLLEVSRGPR